MLDFMKQHWELISAGTIAFVLGIRKWDRVSDLEKRVCKLEDNPCVTIVACEINRRELRDSFSAEFLHCSENFAEIKKHLESLEHKSEERHNMIMKHLLEKRA